MGSLVQRFTIVAVAVMLVASTIVSSLPAVANASADTWDWQRTSPDSWGTPDGEGTMMYSNISSSQEYAGDLWVGGYSYGQGVLWRYDLNGNKTWSDALPGGFDNSRYITSLNVVNSKLYFSAYSYAGAQVWSYDGSAWTNDTAFAALGFESTYRVAPFNGHPCVSGWKNNTPLVYCLVEGSWTNTNIDGAGMTQAAWNMSNLINTNGHMYANGAQTIESSQFEGIWEYDGSNWALLNTPFTDETGSGSGGDWVIGGMTAGPDNSLVVSMQQMGGLVQIYQYKGTTWTKLGDTPNFGRDDSVYYADPQVSTVNGAIVAGVGNNDEGPAVYEWNGDTWTLRNEAFFGQEFNNDGYNPYYVRQMIGINGQLFIATAAPGEGDYYSQIWGTVTGGGQESGPDNDGDGITDSTEAAAPNDGDANNDGFADNTQANVSSFVDSTTNSYVSVALDNECTITSASTQAASANAVKDSGFTYAHGFVNFTANCGDPGYTTTVKVHQYDTSKSSLTVRKYYPATGAYSTVSGATISEQIVGGKTVTIASYSVTDGGELDTDGVANGTIVDPVSLGALSVGTPNTGLRRI